MNIIYVVHQTHLNERSGVPLIAKQYADNAIKANHNVAVLSPHTGYVDSNLNEFKKDKILFYSWPSLDNWHQNAFNYSIKTEEIKQTYRHRNERSLCSMMHTMHASSSSSSKSLLTLS